MTLTVDDLARETGTTAQYIDALVEAGVIRRNPDGSHELEDIARVRLALALDAVGIDTNALSSVVRSGAFNLDWLARAAWATGRPTGRNFAQFAASLGGRAAGVSQIYAAFGLAVPAPDTLMREDEEVAISDFVDMWSMVSDRPDTYLRAARIVGEGVRRIQAGTQDLFDELGGPPGPQQARGKSADDALIPASRLSPVLAQLLVWLQKRHEESETFARIVSYMERRMAERGITEPRVEAEAIAFVDLSGYTELTVEAGDERAAEFATMLQVLAESAARPHHGRVVKLLGDGVMLRYPSLSDACKSVSDLLTAVAGADLPPAHAGIAAGPLVVRDGDVYGHTVNLAARVAAHAQPGSILLAGDSIALLDAAGIGWTDTGSVALKGIGPAVRLVRVDSVPATTR